MTRIFLIAALSTLPFSALADSQLDRLEAVSEEMNLAMAELMARELASKGADPAPMMAALPDTTWDDEHRGAGTCMLDEYRAIGGEDMVENILTNMENLVGEVATATMESLAEIDALPEGVTQEQSADIARSCGFIELSLKRMEESGFTAAMMKAYSTIN